MGDEVDKKKKKKSKKKAEEEPPAPEPEAAAAPEPEPEPEPEPAPPVVAPAPVAPKPVVEATGFGDADFPVDGEEGIPPPPAKQKPKFYLHWDRKKSKFYDYNFDYGENYYSSMVRHLETRGDIPIRRTFADRAIRSSITRKTMVDVRTENLLASVNNCIKGFEHSQRAYVRA